MRSSRRILLAGALPGLALAALASSAAVAESEAEAHKRLKLQQPRLDGEWAPKPAHKPKKGRPTKAEKKAAKRARTRGVVASQPEQGEVFWLYELTEGEGVYQGVRGPDAEKITRQVVSGIEEAGEPFPVRTFGVAGTLKKNDRG